MAILRGSVAGYLLISPAPQGETLFALAPGVRVLGLGRLEQLECVVDQAAH